MKQARTLIAALSIGSAAIVVTVAFGLFLTNNNDADVEVDVVAINNLITTAQQQRTEGRVAEAEKSYEEILELQPSNMIANYNLAQLLANRNSYDLAAKYYEFVLQENPDRHNVRFLYIDALVDAKKTDKALLEVRKAQQEYPAVSQYREMFNELSLLSHSNLS
jgi:tetratricopeptide (TPR) repeat protein